MVYETVLEFWLMRELAYNHSQILSILDRTYAVEGVASYVLS